MEAGIACNRHVLGNLKVQSAKGLELFTGKQKAVITTSLEIVVYTRNASSFVAFSGAILTPQWKVICQPA